MHPFQKYIEVFNIKSNSKLDYSLKYFVPILQEDSTTNLWEAAICLTESRKSGS